jgi:hypothetical protein
MRVIYGHHYELPHVLSGPRAIILSMSVYPFTGISIIGRRSNSFSRFSNSSRHVIMIIANTEVYITIFQNNKPALMAVPIVPLGPEGDRHLAAQGHRS